MTDTEILDWLSLKEVEVRDPLRYGSRAMFFALPTDEDGDPAGPSDLRAQVVEYINKGKV